MKRGEPLIVGKRTLEFLGQGSTRSVYALSDKWVLKVPHDRWGPGVGQAANNWEAHVFKVQGRKPDANGIVRAKCRLLSNGWLVMERVKSVAYSNMLPAWARLIDCCQVGIAHDGQYVAYDYGE